MKFIDEYDGVLRLHQLLHDGFQALFKLATVLGAGHDERQVESQDALICQERRNFAIGDALRQSFDDGSLTYARFADQYWVVLGAAAENMNHALQLAFTSHQRIELGIHRGLDQVAGKLTQQGRFALTLGLAFSWLVRASSSRMVERCKPRSCRISAAKHFSSRSSPNKRCSVPTCLCKRRSASSAAYARTRLHSLLNGRSTEVETLSRIVVCPSICLRMDSTEAWERRKRLVRALSSRSSPNSRCSVSI